MNVTKGNPGAENSGPSFASQAAAEAANSGLTTTAKKQESFGTAEDPNFGDALKKFQSQYGAKPEKAREIKKTLGKDDFLRIMITQMKNQDPTKPFDAEQMASQMAQYASVEQLQNMNQNMGKMLNQQNPMQRLAMTNLIGKQVTLDRNRFPHIENQKDTLNFNLPKDASQVTLSIMSDQGEVIFNKDLGTLKQGENTFGWDGLKNNTLAAKPGDYMFKLDAKDANGSPIQIQSKGQARVVGVSFEGKEAILLVGDPNRPDKIALSNVTQIDDGGPGFGVPGAVPIAQAVGGAAAPKTANPAVKAEGEQAGSSAGAAGFRPAQTPGAQKNLFGFQRGVGSQNLDANQLSPEAQRALAGYEAAQKKTAAANPVGGAAMPATPSIGVSAGGPKGGLVDSDGNPNAGFAQNWNPSLQGQNPPGTLTANRPKISATQTESGGTQ